MIIGMLFIIAFTISSLFAVDNSHSYENYAEFQQYQNIVACVQRALCSVFHDDYIEFGPLIDGHYPDWITQSGCALEFASYHMNTMGNVGCKIVGPWGYRHQSHSYTYNKDLSEEVINKIRERLTLCLYIKGPRRGSYEGPRYEVMHIDDECVRPLTFLDKRLIAEERKSIRSMWNKHCAQAH